MLGSSRGSPRAVAVYGRRQLRGGRPRGGRRRWLVLRWLAGCAITSGSWRGREEWGGEELQTTSNPSAVCGPGRKRKGVCAGGRRGTSAAERQPWGGQPRGARRPLQPVRTPRGSGCRGAGMLWRRPGTCAAGVGRGRARCWGAAVPGQSTGLRVSRTPGGPGWSRLRACLGDGSARKFTGAFSQHPGFWVPQLRCCVPSCPW